MPDVIETARRLKTQLLKRDAAALKQVVSAYQSVVEGVRSEVEALTAKLDKTGALAPGELVKLRQYRALIRAITDEMERYNGYTKTNLRTIGLANIQIGQSDAKLLTTASLGAGVRLSTLNPAVIEKLLGFLAKDGELYKRLDGSPKWTADQVAKYLLEGAARGANPREIARLVNRGLGMGLTDALRTTRTVQIWSYREAARANYIANSHIVQGWVWVASLDGSTCASCIAMHGSVHDLNETLDDHWNGRCAMIPLTIGRDNPIGEGAGRDWFDRLSEDQQRQTLGEGRYNAYKEGKFDFGNLSKRVDDPVFGSMRVEAGLKDLVVDEG